MDNTYNVTAMVTDDGLSGDGKNKMTAMRQVVIMVKNLEEEGEVTFSSEQPKSGVALTAMLSDPDDGVAGVEWQWSWAATNDAEEEGFTVIKDADSDTYTPTDADASRLPAGDGDLHGQRRRRNSRYAGRNGVAPGTGEGGP